MLCNDYPSYPQVIYHSMTFEIPMYAGGGHVLASPLSKSKRRKFSEEGKVNVTEFLMQMTESPPAPRRTGWAGKKKGGKNKTSKRNSVWCPHWFRDLCVHFWKHKHCIFMPQKT